MDIKLFEIRDRATFIPAMAVRLTWRDDQERWLLRRASYAAEQIAPHSELEPYVLLTELDGGKSKYDPYGWDTRTMRFAHQHMLEKWNLLCSGDVIDVEFILGETLAKKRSEREEAL